MGRVALFAAVCGMFQVTLHEADADQTAEELFQRYGFGDDGLKKWDRLRTSVGEAWRNDRYLVITLPEQATTVRFSRLFNRLLSAEVFGPEGRQTAVLKQTPQEWTVTAPTAAKPSQRLIVMVFADRPSDVAPTVHTERSGVVRLAAQHARPHGEKLQYEPQPHKYTVGFWVNPQDWVEWSCRAAAGEYDVFILQGCGRGQGGSRMKLSVGTGSVEFTVQETGHFQRFRWRHLGRTRLTGPGPQRVELRCAQLANRAVMDVREIRLVPRDRADLRPTVVQGEPKPVGRPNVVVFLADDLGTLDLASFGSRDLFTPFTDGLAASGIRFTQAYAHTVCCPARAMLLTGRQPQRSNVGQWTQGDLRAPMGRNMKLEEVTIAEVFRVAGYRTGLFGKWHLGAAPTHGPTRQGFDEFFGLRGGFIDNWNHYFLHQRGYHDLYRGVEEQFRKGEYFPELMTAEAERFIDENHERPFLLYVAWNLPHYPEQSLGGFDQHYVNRPQPRQSYGKVVSTVDQLTGRILQRLERWGIDENTIVLFTSDNGHSAEDYQISVEDHASLLPKGHDYGAHGGGGNTAPFRGTKNTFFEGGLRVPAILSYPAALPPSATCQSPVTMMDWLPTLVELAGVEPPAASLDGRSVLRAVREPESVAGRILHWQWFDRWCVRDGQWKLIHDSRLKNSEGTEVFLGRVDGQQPEAENLARQHPEIVARLTSLHEQWIQAVTLKEQEGPGEN